MRILLVVWACMPLGICAQEHTLKRIGAQAHYGFIFAHSDSVENTAGSRPYGVYLEYSKLKFDSATYNIARCYPHSGISLSYFNYDNAVLGHSLGVAYFLEPSFWLVKGVLMAPRASLGLYYLTRPHHPIRNPNNNSYSLPISAFLQVGMSAYLCVAQKSYLSTSLNYLHISNGGIKDPNMGINWPTASLGFYYQLNEAVFQKQVASASRFFITRNRLDIGGYSSLKAIGKGEKKLYPVPGFFAAYHRRLSNLHSMGMVADIHWDYSLAQKQSLDQEPRDIDFTSLAISHEFLMGKFSFGQQLGYYVIPPNWRFGRFYHRWGLQYRVAKSISVGVGLKAHAQVAHFAELRCAYHLDY